MATVVYTDIMNCTQFNLITISLKSLNVQNTSEFGFLSLASSIKDGKVSLVYELLTKTNDGK